MSGANSKIAVTISATDLASKQIAEVNKHIALMQTPAERASKSVGRLTNVDRVGKLAADIVAAARKRRGEI